MSTYPTKTHTQANSIFFYQHIISVFDPTEIKNIFVASKEEGIKSLMDFIGTPAEDFASLEYFDEEGVPYLMRTEK